MGMNAGVSTTPRANVMRPRRAVPSRAKSSNRMGVFLARIAREHEQRVAVAEKPVPLGNGVPVSGERLFEAREPGDKHEQRRLGQVEVRDERIDDPKPESGPDEQARLAREWRKRTALRSRLERAHGRGAGGN